MVHPYIINRINALVLILAGIVVYFADPAKPLTELAIPFVGVLFLACTYHLRRHNRFVLHTVTAITLLTGFLLIWRIEPEVFVWDVRHILLLLMSLSCFGAVAFYVSTFIKERRLRNNTIYKDDL